MSGTRRSRKRTRPGAGGTSGPAPTPAAPSPPARPRADAVRIFVPLAVGAVVGVALTAYGLGWVQLLIVVVAFGVIYSSLARIRRARRGTSRRPGP